MRERDRLVRVNVKTKLPLRRFWATFLVVSMLMSLLPWQSIIGYAEGNEKDLGNIFEFESLMLLPGTLEETLIDGNEIIEYSEGQGLVIRYKWEVDSSLGAVDGDTAHIFLPTVFKVPANFPPQPIVITDEGDNITVGEYSLDAQTNLMRFVFNENIEEISVKEGFVGFGVTFNLEEFSENSRQTVDFRDRLQKDMIISLRPQILPPQLAKAGYLNAQIDPDLITWQIDFVNTDAVAYSAITLKDLIPQGLQYIDESLSVTKITMGQNGSLNIQEDLTLTLLPTLDTFESQSTLAIVLPDLIPYVGYRLTLTTAILDELATQFDNRVTVEYTRSDQPDVPYQSTTNHVITNFTRSELMEKRATRITGNDSLINWVIDVNKPGKALENISVEDTLPPGLSLVPGTLKVYHLTKVGDNFIKGSEVVLDPPQTQFPLVLGDIAPQQSYRIEYQTGIDYTLVNGGNYRPSSMFTNQAQLISGENILRTVDDEITIDRPTIIEKVGSAINYQQKINWTIHVNKAKHAIENAVVTDVIPGSLTVNPADVKVYIGPTDTTVYPAAVVAYNNETRELRVELGDITTDYRIVFPTTIEQFNINNLTNTGTLTGVGVNGHNSATRQLSLPTNDYVKETVGINYDTSTIAWRIYANPKREPITQLVIDDVFTNKGLNFLENSLLVTHRNSENVNVPLVRDTDYTLVPKDDSYQNGFTLTLLPNALPLTGLLDIRFNTSYREDYSQETLYAGNDRRHFNQAKFTGLTSSNQAITETKNANRQVNAEAWNNGDKLGSLKSYTTAGNLADGWVSGNERAIEWQVFLNYRKEDLGTGVVITDTWNYPGTLDEDSVRLQKYTVASNGARSLTQVDIDPTHYTKDYNSETNELIITFKEGFGFDDRYALVYTTGVPNFSLESYANTAVIDYLETNKSTYEGVVTYNPFNTFLQKTQNVTGTNVYIDDEITWRIMLNESLSIIDQAKIVDRMSPGQVYLEDSLQVYRYEVNTPVLLVEGEDARGYTKTIIPDGNDTLMTISFNGTMNVKHLITYKTAVVVMTGQINNTVTFTGAEEFVRNQTTQQLTANQYSFVGGVADPNKGNLVIRKLDDDTNQLVTTTPTTFEIYYYLNGQKRTIGGNDARFSTQNGLLTLSNVSFRTYYIQEITPPVGYFAKAAPLEVQLSTNDISNTYNTTTRTKTVNIENTSYKGDIEFIKHDEFNNPQEGATFELFKNGSQTPNSQVTSDVNGLVRFVRVPYGQYTIKEKTAPVGYTVNQAILQAAITEDEQLIFARPQGNNGSDRFVLTNTKIRGSIRITKADEDQPNVRLSGVAFEVKRILSQDTQLFIGSYTTNQQGIIQIDNLEYGTYTIRELEAPTGYELDSTIYTVAIQTNGAIVDQTITNKRIPVGSVSITKRDSLTHEPIEGVTFTLKNEQDVIVATPVTNSSGQILLEGLPPGAYKLQESQAAPEYYTSDVIHELTISAFAATSLIIENEPYRKISITKVDQVNQNIKLQGAIFQLRDVDGNVIMQSTTNAQGIVNFQGLEYGTYTVRETKAPFGYQLDTAVQEIVIDAQSPKVVPVIFTNTKLPTLPPEPELESEQTTVAPSQTQASPTTAVVVAPTSLTPRTNRAGEPTTSVPNNTAYVNTPIIVLIDIPEGGVVTIKEDPENGTIEVIPGGNVVYTPNDGFIGRDSATLLISTPEFDEELFMEFDIIDIPLGDLNIPFGGELPQTGETAPLPFYIFGMLVLLIGIKLRFV